MISTLVHVVLLLALLAPFFVEMQRDSFDDETESARLTRISRRCFWVAIALFAVCAIYYLSSWQSFRPIEVCSVLFMVLFSLATLGYYYWYYIRPNQTR